MCTTPGRGVSFKTMLAGASLGFVPHLLKDIRTGPFPRLPSKVFLKT
jgi:hypothetical protein